MFKVKVLQPEIDYTTRRMIARHEILEGNYGEFYDEIDKEKEYDMALKQHRNIRSLDANSYFHVLCGKIAEKIGSSKSEVKNRMISLYGQPYLIDGKLDYIIVREDKQVEKSEYMHLQPTPQTKELNGVLYRVYINMRHTGKNDDDNGYDSREFSILIDGTISEAKEIGLSEAEIMSPKEKEMLEQKYGVVVK